MGTVCPLIVETALEFTLGVVCEMALGCVSVAEAVKTIVAQDFALVYAHCAFVGIFVGVFQSG